MPLVQENGKALLQETGCKILLESDISIQVFPTSIAYEVYVGAAWLNLAADVVLEAKAFYGIDGNTEKDRIASTGELTITLRNDETCIGGVSGFYSPYNPGAMVGWKTGLPFRVKLSFEGTDYIEFYGHIKDIQSNSGTFGLRRVKVTVLDWMDIAANHPILLPTLLTSKRIDEIAPVIITSMPAAVRPLHTDYKTGAYTFATVFDTVRSNTKAMSEYSKLALSELGYVYIKRDIIDGETLVIEGKNTRNVYSTIKASFRNNMLDLKVGYGHNLVNDVHVKVYPRLIDAAATTILCNPINLDNPLSLGAGATINIHVPYRDPNGGAPKACGMDMAAPLGYDDDPVNYTFRMSVNDDDTGGDLSAFLTVTPTYGLEAVDYILTNTGVAGYVTLLKAKGRGIYIYDSVENVATDATSRDLYGYKSDIMDMKYQDDVNTAASVAAIFLARNKAPREIPESITFLANITTPLMRAFLNIDVGDLIQIAETQTGIDGYFYIQKVEFTIKPPLIYFTWSLKEALTMSEFYWILEDPIYSILDVTTVLGY